MPKRIPITAARKLAEEHHCQQVIVLAWDGENAHVVTYGSTKEQCRQAAQGGDLVKIAMKWPADLMSINSIEAKMITEKALHAALEKIAWARDAVSTGAFMDTTSIATAIYSQL